MGLFGKSLAGIIIDAITNSSSSSGLSSSSWEPSIPTTTTTVPTIPGMGSGGIFDTLEKLDTVLMDVDTEGQKRGYERAAAEYDAAFERVEKEYLETKRLIDKQIATKGSEASGLISKLQELEREKEKLNWQIKDKTRQVSSKFNISTSSVSQSLASGTLLIGGSGTGVLDMIYMYKSKKLKEAEEKGYSEARRLYRKKIRELKDNAERLKIKGNVGVQELMNLISDAIREISEAETKIAELEIALNS